MSAVRYEVVEAFLFALGLDPPKVREVWLSAASRTVEITTFRLDPDGSKFCDPETGEIALDTEVREIAGGVESA